MTTTTPPEPYSFLTTLLPLIITSSPAPLPSTLLSKPTRLAHTYLNPEVGSSSYYCLSSREEYDVERLRETLVTDSYGDWNLGKAEWEFDSSEGEVRVRVSLGREGLCVILLWEEQQSVALSAPTSHGDGSPQDQEDDRPAWTFLTLSLLEPTSASTFKPSLEEAMNAQHRPSAITIPDSKLLKAKDPDDMAQGEGTTPGAYGAAEDFWQGWSDDEDPSKANGTAAKEPVAKVDDEETAEAYWSRYGDVEPMADDGRETDEFVAQKVPTRPGSVTRSRRSSTIKPPLRTSASSSPSTLTSEFGLGSAYVAPDKADLVAPSSPPLQPTLFSAFPSSLNLADSLSSTQTSPLSPATDGHGFGKSKVTSLGFLVNDTNHDGGAVESESQEETSLRLAMAGLWQLYSGSRGGSVGEDLETKREKWNSMASVVTRC